MTNTLKTFLTKKGYVEFLLEDHSMVFVNESKGIAFQLDNKDIHELSDNLRKKNLNAQNILELKELLIPNQKSKAIPFHIQWHITNACNLRCKHCYQEDYLKDELRITQLKRIANELIKFCNNFGFNPEFSLTGGEPLLSKNLFPLIKHIRNKSKKATINIMTNGTLLNNSLIKKMRLLRINFVQVSLESPNHKANDLIRGKGEYDMVINVIKLLKQNKVKVALHLVLSKKNHKDIDSYVRLASKLSINLITFSNLVPIGSGKKMLSDLLQPKELKVYQKILAISKKRNYPNTTFSRPLWCLLTDQGGYCPVGIKTISIMPNGDLMPCRRMNLTIGNISKKSFIGLWFGTKILWKLRDKSNIKICGECNYYDTCGGCRALALAVNDDYLGPDPQCWRINSKLGVLK
jgi:radical SAM protein with 4Fe4S-binding SPASM domain